METANGKRKSKETFFSLKFSNPKIGAKKIPLDFTLFYSPSSPALFDKFTQGHSGSIFLLDASFPLQWIKKEKWSVYFGLGALVSHFDFKLRQSEQNFGSSKTELGYSAKIVGGYRIFEKYLVKLEGVYLKAGTDQIGVNLSLQRSF